MEILAIDATEESPKISFNPTTGILEISGRSILEDALPFYTPVLEWLTQYLHQPHTSSVLTIKLEYLNTSSSKALFDILATLEDIEGVKVMWYFKEGNEEMEETGEEFSELVRVPFELIPY